MSVTLRDLLIKYFNSFYSAILNIKLKLKFLIINYYIKIEEKL
jgi:hypothetical protein